MDGTSMEAVRPAGTEPEALVFHPDGHGGADLVAKIKIEDWPSLTRY
jgi:hypothetical protein